MSLQTAIDFPAKKRTLRKRVANKSDCENDSKYLHAGVKRSLFDCSKSLKKRKLVDKKDAVYSTTNVESQNCAPGLKLFKQDTSFIQDAKHAFHTSLPSLMVGRDKEIDEISNFLKLHVDGKKSGSLYISGAPGTGKTSCLMHVLKNMSNDCKYAFVNCMSVTNPTSIYNAIADELHISKSVSSKNVIKCIENYIATSKSMIVLVLDEIDHLDSKGQEILYSIFTWPQMPDSSVILIGIANALDLTDRVLPRLQTFKYEPVLMHFQPYTYNGIVAILENRLSEVRNAKDIISSNAVHLCARKIAACTGDIRKALDVCRRSIEINEKQAKQQLLFKSSDDDRCNPGSPSKRVVSCQPVDLRQISAVVNNVYGSRIQTSTVSTKKQTVTLPLQQVMILCSLILMKKFCKDKDINSGSLYDVYRRVCKKRQMAIVGESEFRALCQLIEARGFIELKKHNVARMTKVFLRIEEGEIEHIMQDKTLLASVLADSSVISKK